MVRLIASELEIMIPIADPMWYVTKVGNIGCKGTLITKKESQNGF